MNETLEQSEVEAKCEDSGLTSCQCEKVQSEPVEVEFVEFKGEYLQVPEAAEEKGLVIDVDDEEKLEDDVDEEKDNPRQMRYYVVRNVDASYVSKKAAARFIEDEIDAGKDKDKFVIVKGKQLELNFEVKTKVVIR